MLPKVTEIAELLNMLPLSLLALTETWLDESNADLINLPGYHFIHRSREGKRGGGVGHLIKDGISYQIIDTIRSDLSPFKTCDGLFVRVTHKIGSTIIGVIYRPPGPKLEEFSDELNSILEDVMIKS